ncbi:MAG: tRNA (adenosine(37)-N6)-threonylcarbamoyltransferase complex ATPase subunit type 1 TsaE [Planctomycetota bacterium]
MESSPLDWQRQGDTFVASGVDSKLLSEIGDRFAKLDLDRLVVALVGTLGAGKTTLVQAIAAAHGVDRANVTSPTFTLMQRHHGTGGGGQTRMLYHLDTYRVADVDEWMELGVDELLQEPSTWLLIEWADRFADWMPDETLWVHLEMDPDSTRTITLRGHGADAIATSLRES